MNIVEQICKTYAIDLRRSARALVHEEAEAQDLVQDVLVKALCSHERLESMSEGSRKAWLLRVMRNTHIDHVRKGRFEVRVAEHDGIVVDDVDSRLQAGIAIDHLDRELRDVVSRKYLADMTSSQIAKELSVPAGTVRYRLHVAMKLLRSMLQSGS